MKQVPNSIKDIVTSDAMLMALDHSQVADDLADMIVDEAWGYDLFSRKPGPAYYDEDGQLNMTDLDLICFLAELTKRKAVVNLPEYKKRRAGSTNKNERVVSDKNRHGKILSVVANKEVFSFSLKVNDQNVIVKQANGEEIIGAPRNFMLVDVTGEWHSGWRTIEFSPTAKENEWLNDKRLWTGQSIFFKNFVHPNRWTAFYGAYYLLTKVLIQRLEDEQKFYNAEEKVLIEAGAKFPPSDSMTLKPEYERVEPEDQKSIKVDAFECQVDAPFLNEFKHLAISADGAKLTKTLVDNHDRMRKIKYHILPMLRLATRAVELAFFKVGMKDAKMPFWMKDYKWEEGFKEKGKRIEWNRLGITQVKPGTTGFALRYRTYQKTERVAAE